MTAWNCQDSGVLLPRPDRVGARLERHLDRRQSREHAGLELGQPRDPVEELVLHRVGDQILHLLGGEPERLDLHVHPHRPELRQGLDRRVAKLYEADGHQGDGDGEHQSLIFDA
nr:hypothetical protein [Micromonospora sp. RTP1Z1]